MSRSVSHEKTHGFLEDLSKARKLRKQIRAMKTSMLNEIEMIAFPPVVPAQEF